MTPASESDEVTIRPAERADLLAIFRIEKAAFPQPWPFSAFETFLDEPGFLVAVDADGAVLGYVVGDTTPNFGRDIGHVKDLAVHPEARRRGVGARLLDRALASLAATGAAVVKLEVRASNDAARALYHGVGFDPLRRVRRYYEDGEDALVMVLDLREWHESREDGESSPDAGSADARN